jgi:hypothetical protein
MKKNLELISVHSGNNENELGGKIEAIFIERGYTPSFAGGTIGELLEKGYDNFIFLLSDKDSIKENETSISEIDQIIKYSNDENKEVQIVLAVKGKVTVKKSLEKIPKFELKEDTELLELYHFVRDNLRNKFLEKVQKKVEGTIEELKVDKRSVAFQISGGRETFNCELRLHENILESLLNSDFEKYNFIQGFEAIWSSELGVIECEIDSNTPPHFLVRLLSDFIETESEVDEEIDDESDDDSSDGKRLESISYPFQDDTKIDIGKSSEELSILLMARSAMPSFRNRIRSFTSIRISNIDLSKHDQALEILLRISNSILFQIDIVLERAFFLKGQRENYNELRKRNLRRKSTIDENIKLGFPKFQYDKEPMSLYWYAKSNNEKPLFQFLSFYQVIEYYYPIYSSTAAKKKIQNFIKSPKFNADRDKDISNILSLIQIGAGGKSFGSEKEQLKSTLEGATDNNDLRTFFDQDEERKLFYEKNKTKGFIKQKITLNNPTADLIEEVTQRIYEIRCKIVHSKSSSEDFDIILPFSSNVKKIQYDIELAEFIARKVLIGNSKSLEI